MSFGMLQQYISQQTNFPIQPISLPTPEGLPPATSASQLDGYLVDLINRYSLRGQSILVHCRGGVGRAGVFACCWMIRLGLCGWPEEVEHHSDSTDKNNRDAAVKLTIKNDQRKKRTTFDTIDFVKSVIALVRRRRSMKAIETYEQVEFWWTMWNI
jgi:protein-tyrosine phosphatase